MADIALKPTVPRYKRRILAFAAAGLASLMLGLGGRGPASAQGKHNIEGTPLDTIMNTHLTPDVPDSKDFVKESRPDPSTLTYAPLSAPEPERPKPLAPKDLKSLQAELEAAAAKNAQRAGRPLKPAPKTKAKGGER